MSHHREYPFPEMNHDKCKGCGLCVISCPREVLVISEKLNSKGYHYSVYKDEGCIGCGNCFYTCPEPNAVAVYMKDYVPEEVS